jgi:hypothetical protein
MVARVCDAVQHAHQRGLVHRDLKPDNILVDESGQPKVLDFGVARITDCDTKATWSRTGVGQLLGTLPYMSPEQALADPLEVDTRSDVYTLGVVLYELLSARLPYALSEKMHEALHTIREQDPARLSSVNREYRGDIETIVAKALEKDKTRRYASASELAADIRRHLRDEPIMARPPSATYQLQKFVRRHKALVGGTAVFVVLMAGMVTATLLAVRASRAELDLRDERGRLLQANKELRNERDRAVAEKTAVEEESKALAQGAGAVRQKAGMDQLRSERDRTIAGKTAVEKESKAPAQGAGDVRQKAADQVVSNTFLIDGTTIAGTIKTLDFQIDAVSELYP